MRNRIILASSSPRRKEILQNIGVQFEVIAADIDETEEIFEGDPSDFVKDLSVKKAEAVLNDIDEKKCKNLCLIAADTVVYNGQIYGKPKDRDEASDMLRSLSGKTHQVFTGISVIYFNNNSEKTEFAFADKTDVTMWELSDYEIDAYVSSGEGDDKAGAYAIQGNAALFIKKILGDYNNVVGFPLSKLYQECKIRGIELL